MSNSTPSQIACLMEDAKKLDAVSLEHIAAIVKELANKKENGAVAK